MELRDKERFANLIQQAMKDEAPMERATALAAFEFVWWGFSSLARIAQAVETLAKPQNTLQPPAPKVRDIASAPILSQCNRVLAVRGEPTAEQCRACTARTPEQAVKMCQYRAEGEPG